MRRMKRYLMSQKDNGSKVSLLSQNDNVLYIEKHRIEGIRQWQGIRNGNICNTLLIEESHEREIEKQRPDP